MSQCSLLIVVSSAEITAAEKQGHGNNGAQMDFIAIVETGLLISHILSKR